MLLKTSFNSIRYFYDKVIEAGELVAESDNKPQVSFQASSGANRAGRERIKLAGLGSVSISKIIYDDGAIEKNVKSQKMRTLAAPRTTK